MGSIWNGILRQYGQRVTLCSQEGQTAVRAFLQPVREMAPGSRPTPLGRAPEGHYLYLGPAEAGLDRVEWLEHEGRRFGILRHRAYRIGDEAVYRWALCRELDREEEAG